MKNIYVLGGGTFNHVRNHLSIAAPAFGKTARFIYEDFNSGLMEQGLSRDYQTHLILTKMADPNSTIVTNDDVCALVDRLIADPDTKVIIFNMALADFKGTINDVPSGKYAKRLKTSAGDVTMKLTPSEKLIGKIRQSRKDIFVVGFKTTSGADSHEQYVRGLELLKTNSLNLVLANDVFTRNNMIIAPEETRYHDSSDREDTLSFLTDMTIARMQNTFTRSTIVKGDAIAWSDPRIPENLRAVVDHCIKQGAYKPFLGKTAGHFAVKVDDMTILTSIRKSNFNNLPDIGLVKVESSGEDTVIAHGFKPSVGGQSQRIVFKNHPDLDCIVHFHAPMRQDSPFIDHYPCAPQWPNECGSHQCGQNTSNNLQEIDVDGHKISFVFLDNHGPNIVFNRNVPAEKVIGFINENFNLSEKNWRDGIIMGVKSTQHLTRKRAEEIYAELRMEQERRKYMSQAALLTNMELEDEIERLNDEKYSQENAGSTGFDNYLIISEEAMQERYLAMQERNKRGW